VKMYGAAAVNPMARPAATTATITTKTIFFIVINF
jgi:hypothetical protein